MRQRFDEQLELLNVALIEMGGMIENAIADASAALVLRSAEKARAAIACDKLIDDKEKEIEALCLKLLLQQQPVARDLRFISSALKMITDMERIGDQASDISELTIHLSHENAIEPPPHIQRMADATVSMVRQAVDAFVKRDLDLAMRVIATDDLVDDLFQRTRVELIGIIREAPEQAEQAVDLMMATKYFERIGDHAENIAGWVVFSISGKHEDKEL